MTLCIVEPVAVRESILEKATLQLIPGSRVGATQTKEKSTCRDLKEKCGSRNYKKSSMWSSAWEIQ